MSENKYGPGPPITRAAYPPGAGTPSQEAMQNTNAASQHQANANRALAGGKRRKQKSYIGGNMFARQYINMPYKPTGGPDSTPNAQMAGNTQTYAQMAANSKLDGRAQAGGNPDWHCPCLKGGKKRTKKNKRKVRNNSMYRRRKSRKHRKSHKRNKSRKH